MCVCAYGYLVVLGLSYSMQELQSSLQYTGSFSCGMAILSGKIPWRVEPGGQQSMGSQRVGHD